LKILNGLKVARFGAVEPTPYELDIHQAAAGVAAQVGVCDTFAARSAVIARTSGHQGVRTVGDQGHRWTEAGGQKIDPWENPTHVEKSGGGPLGGDTAFDHTPQQVAADFATELTACKGLLPGVKSSLPRQELAAYEALLGMRGEPGGFGTLASRETADANKKEENAAVVRRIAEKRALLGGGGKP